MPNNSVNIRNFCIIAHIDHGKSTLADRLLELTGTVEKRKMREQFLDQMDLERERGITIKLQPVRMSYTTRINADCDADKRGLLYEDLTYKIRGICFKIYNELGPAFKEIIYQNALENEFIKNNLQFEREKIIDIFYDGKKVGIYKPDFIVENKIIIELKALPFLGKLEIKQIWHYLKGSDYRLALLINFGSTELQIERIVYDSIRDNPRFDPRESAYILNLIDTPGHVDFGYEVSRSLAAVEGAILLVDASKGIQAQTLANLYLAAEQGLEIIPVINKIDLPTAKVEETEKEIRNVLGIGAGEEILKISAKTGVGIERILEEIVKRVPPPLAETGKPLRALIFDSKYDDYKGVIAFVRIVDGLVKRGDKIAAMASETKSEVIETGIFLPGLKAKEELSAGEIGYIATGFKDVESCRVGDTITNLKSAADPLLGYKEPKPMVFASFYPQEGSDFDLLKDALSKLKLNDASLSFKTESSQALGRGFLCGFLGMLHMEIVSERLRREYGLSLIITTPSVNYKAGISDKREIEIKTASEFPDPSRIEYVSEPWIRLEIITPGDYINSIMVLVKKTRGFYKKTEYISETRMVLVFEVPLADIITDFYDDLKSVSSGYASMNYELLDFRAGDLVKMDILIAGEKVEAFSRIVPRDKSRADGRALVKKLKEEVPPQLFAVAIQAAVGGEIIARETLKAMRKDVTGYLYGGDRTRKDKLLKKQKKGKKRLKEMGKVRISQEVFLRVLKK